MRELKFRAWDAKSSKMIQVHDMAIDINGRVLILPASSFDRTAPTGYLEVMQFTLLKDKNGTDIYEGDIVWSGEFRTDSGDRKAAVIESTDTDPMRTSNRWFISLYTLKVIGNGIYCGIADFDDSENREVIGNIYANPELVEIK